MLSFSSISDTWCYWDKILWIQMIINLRVTITFLMILFFLWILSLSPFTNRSLTTTTWLSQQVLFSFDSKTSAGLSNDFNIMWTQCCTVGGFGVKTAPEQQLCQVNKNLFCPDLHIFMATKLLNDWLQGGAKGLDDQRRVDCPGRVPDWQKPCLESFSYWLFKKVIKCK